MRVVLDTNVLMSGVFFGGPPGRILLAWQQGQLSLLTSPEILEEYVAVGDRLRRAYPDVDPAAVLALIVHHAQLVEPRALDEQGCTDPDDDKFLACALGGGGKYVVSGDRALLAVRAYASVEVIRPRAFCDAVLGA